MMTGTREQPGGCSLFFFDNNLNFIPKRVRQPVRFFLKKTAYQFLYFEKYEYICTYRQTTTMLVYSS